MHHVSSWSIYGIAQKSVLCNFNLVDHVEHQIVQLKIRG